MQRWLLEIVWNVGISMSIKKELDALMKSFLGCKVKRRAPNTATRIDIGMSIKKELDALMMSLH